ncbi:MAG: 3-hydroxybutyryl-CoA dehydrogenase [bacterium]|nr:3-hydroxybutyryl-CoA dehydrogenase [bacterium]
MDIFGIVGAGVMGTDVAHLAAESGFEVILYDIDPDQSKAAIEKIKTRLNKYLEQGRITHDHIGEINSRIKIHQHIQDIARADIILEAVTEDIDIKRDVFALLDKICKPGIVMASNTSSISITEIASATDRPESVIGLHFLNPVRVMKIVEIISGLSTTRETFEMAKTIVKQMGKNFVEAKDFPGFFLNRMLVPMVNEAIYLLYEGKAKAEAIDKVMRTGLNIPMGPLALADMIGLDIVLAVIEEMYHGYSDPKYRPCPLLRQYVAAGYLGQKSGRGFYRY